MKKLLYLPVRLSLFLGLILLLWPVSYSHSQETQQDLHEYGVKAVYLYNFLQFVDWPSGKCNLNGRRVEEIAVIGDSPVGDSLQALQKQLKANNDIEISLRFLGPYHEGMDLSGCRLLFITKSEMNNIKKILANIGDSPTLTVGDTEECIAEGCMVALVSRMNKVRWSINRQLTDQAGMRFNSRILKMAVTVFD